MNDGYDVSLLRPTQITVGMAEVHEKARHLRTLGTEQMHAHLTANPVPVVKRVGHALYIIDHHHLALAVRLVGHYAVAINIVATIRMDEGRSFWNLMQSNGWCHPYDENGKLSASVPSALPERVQWLRDDPYRSLAWLVRHAGGYLKTDAPFAEFKWADLFRQTVRKPEFDKHGMITCPSIIGEAVAVARSNIAASLPGFNRDYAK